MSKTTLIVLSVLLVVAIAAAGLLLFSCLGQPAPEPTPTALPPTAELPPEATPVPGVTPVADPVWQRIQAAGKIVVGTSGDYPPFEYYTEQLALDGFDIALMNEIAARLGLQIEWHDIAFDGLGAALQVSQIDAAIAGISVNEEREAVIDFSNVYYVGDNAALAQQGSNIQISAIEDFGAYRLGVQRATVYEYWAETQLVESGILHPDQLFVYERAEDAVRDLREARLELVAMDALPAKAYAAEGGVVVIGEGLNPQRFAIAVPTGASELQARLNQALTELSNAGILAELSRKYLDLEPGEVLPTPTPLPAATSTPRPVVTTTPAPPPACQDSLAFVQHLNYDDQNQTNPPQMNPGQKFTKGWRVKNTGTCTWTTAYRLVYAQGNVPEAKMGGQPVNVTRQVAPGETYDIQVDLVAPGKAGTYFAQWQMTNAAGKAFGERLPVSVRVQAQPQPTPVPTQTPVPGISFTVDRTQIKYGECVVFSWNVQNVKEVYFYAEGESWENNGVAGQGRQTECPPYTMNYYLRVVKNDNSVDTRTIRITVLPAEGPAIRHFTVDPSSLAVGQCVTIKWKVEGAIDQVDISVDGRMLWADAPNSGNTQDCPGSTGNPVYRIDARGPGGTSQQQEQVEVSEGNVEPPPPPTDPVIYSFSVAPGEIQAGACVNIVWSAGGGTSWINIVRNETIILENAPLEGNAQDCPDETGDLLYRMVAYNPEDQRTNADQTVRVNP